MFDYRDYLPKKTDKPNSPPNIDIQDVESVCVNGVEYFVVQDEYTKELCYITGCSFNTVRIQCGVHNRRVQIEDIVKRPSITSHLTSVGADDQEDRSTTGR
jgi:hypothetical protein